jgi:hypothetical protein
MLNYQEKSLRVKEKHLSGRSGRREKSLSSRESVLGGKVGKEFYALAFPPSD